MSSVSDNIKAILSGIPLGISVEKRIERLAGVEAVDRGFVAKHAISVANTASEIARSIGMNEREVDDLAYAVRWHDLGKLAIPDEILRKPARLDDDESAIMKSHTEAGLVLIDGCAPGLLRDVVLYHHERYDGNGYNGLKGEKIPLPARITAIADVHDALMENRDYKNPLTEECTLELMTRDNPGFGRYAFDPFLLRKFISLRLDDAELRFLPHDFDYDRLAELIGDIHPYLWLDSAEHLRETLRIELKYVRETLDMYRERPLEFSPAGMRM
ncbi:HD-GYP domain-containing protein [Roseibium sp. RKSG952]|uniref:HD-GYP domain-containing protein n=1 Tax=Roseibium sp. RKSG952 TaxID=2529384 RepID=UPI0012BCDAC4|nr:HD domain-containing phosphohydrolase [Roseibium sp. RKSG952]MTH95203.1 HD domain-containing protein [Roseibium sp. RKSG952]